MKRGTNLLTLLIVMGLVAGVLFGQYVLFQEDVSQRIGDGHWTKAAGDLLLTVEAMKLEHAVHAPTSGVVTDLKVEAGTQVEAGALLAVLSPD